MKIEVSVKIKRDYACRNCFLRIEGDTERRDGMRTLQETIAFVHASPRAYAMPVGWSHDFQGFICEACRNKDKSCKF
jgi:hypothetical protein